LQIMPGLPLSVSFAEGGDGRCPSCELEVDQEGSDTY
jgi:hypothetical protein